MMYKNPSKFAAFAGLIAYGLSNLYSDYYSKNTLIYQKTQNNLNIIKNCPSIKAGTYYPTFYLPTALSMMMFVHKLMPKNKSVTY